MVASHALSGQLPLTRSWRVGAAVELQVVDSFAAIPEPTWEDLWRRDPRAGVYQTHAWYAAWERQMLAAVGARLRIVLARAENRLLGACALAIQPRREGVHRGRVLTFASSLSSAYPLDQGPLLDPAGGEPVLEAMAGAIANLGGFDFILFEHFERESRAADLLAALGGRLGRAPRIEFQEHAHLVELAPTWDAFLEGLGARTRRNVRAYAKKFSQQPGRTITVATDADQLAKLIDALAEQKGRRFGEEGRVSNFDEAALTAFLKDAGAALLARGMLLPLMACLDEGAGPRIGATQLVLHDPHGHIYSYNSSFDPRDKELRLHYLLESERIRQAIELGYTRLDLSTGHAEHKQHWTLGRTRELQQGWIATSLFGRVSHAVLVKARALKRRFNSPHAEPPAQAPDPANAADEAS